VGHLQAWLQERKSEFVVEGLKPGIWFQAKNDEWKEERIKLRKGHLEFTERRKKEPGLGDDDSSIDLTTVQDIHNADGDGMPVYAGFKYEDWLILSWRYELHLLVHAFLEDAADKDLTGIPESHLGHYYKLYYGQTFDPKGKIGADGLVKTLHLLKEPLELVEGRPGHRILASKLDRTVALETFVKGVEAYRRDRQRRLDAGDESALLSFPRPQKAVLAKAAPGKASPQQPSTSVKGSGKGASVTAPGKAPVAKQPVNKAAPKAVIAKQVIAKTSPTPPKAAPRPIVKMGGNGAAVKRPLPPQDGAALKRVRSAEPQQIAKAPIAKTPIAKRRPV